MGEHRGRSIRKMIGNWQRRGDGERKGGGRNY